jgi:outer membrane protein assembly factor BamA
MAQFASVSPELLSVSAFPFLSRVLFAASLVVAAPWHARAQSARPRLGLHDSMTVSTVTFPGAVDVSASDLRGVIFTRPSPCRLVLVLPACKLFPTNQLFIDRRRTTPAALGEDITALRVYYWRRGFRDATVDTIVTRAKHGWVDVAFRVDEGAPTRVASLTVTQRLPVLTPAELANALVLRAGEPLSLIALDTVVARLHDATWNHGYGDVRVDTSVPRPDAARLVPIRIDIDPRYVTRVGGVRFEGNHSLSDATLRRGLMLQPGALYTRDAVLESERRLFESPALARALVVTPPLGDSLKQITVAVTESPVHRANATLGFNTIDYVQASVELRDNALGSGRWLQTRATVGNLLASQLNGRAIFRRAVADDEVNRDLFLRPTYQASATLTQPWIAGPRTSASLTLFGGRRSLPGVVVDEDIGASIGVVRELAIRMPVGLSYRLESTRVQGGAVYFCAGYGICDAATMQALTTRQRLAPVGASAWIDRSDDLEVPTRGYTAVVDAEHASSLTGSTFSHDRIAADAAWYHAFGVRRENIEDPVTPRVLALHARGGFVRPFGDGSALGLATGGPGILHPRARFYAGGMQSVRGFAENDLGPRVLQVRRTSLLAGGCTDATIAAGSCDPSGVPSSDFFTRPTGGSTLVEGSAELRVPVLKQLGAVIFVDGAYVGTSNIVSIAHGKGAITPGGGFRYRSPLGVLRLDIGLHPVRAETLPVVVAVADSVGNERIVRLAQEQSYSPIDPSTGVLHSIGRRLVVHFAMGQAF